MSLDVKITKRFDGFTLRTEFTAGNTTAAILGASGCGKSMTLRCIAGIVRPDSGRIVLDGRVLFDSEQGIDLPPQQRNVGLLFQNYALFPNMTVEQNILCALKKEKDPAARKAACAEALRAMRLEELAHRLPSELSGGQQQRAALARILAGKPRILMLDEPLGALDLKLRKEMQLELKRLQREMNITFIYVTHDQEEALTMSDTVVVMNGGKVQQIGTPEDIYNEPKNAFVADFIGDSNIVDGVMHKDFLVSFSGVDFPCVDRGFAREQSVQVVVRPEDIEVVSPVEGQLVGVVNDVIFKGVHFEMHVECEGREWLIHSTRACTPGETIGMRIGPNEIHIMARSEG